MKEKYRRRNKKSAHTTGKGRNVATAAGLRSARTTGISRNVTTVEGLRSVSIKSIKYTVVSVVGVNSAYTARTGQIFDWFFCVGGTQDKTTCHEGRKHGRGALSRRVELRI